MAFESPIMRPFTSKAFYIGLALTALIYGGAITWAGLSSGTYLQNIQNALASQTLPIERVAGAVSAAISEDHDGELHPQGQLLDDERVEPPSLPDEHEHAPAQHDQEAHSTEAHAQHDDTIPVAGLFETTSSGDILPVIRSADGLTPFKAYSKDDLTIPAGKPVIALVVNDVGLSESVAQELNNALPAEITFIANPYASKLGVQEKLWHEKKREIWLKIPFESLDFPLVDPGMRGILTRSSLAANMHNFTWALSRAHGYAGIAASVDSSYLQSRPLLSAIAKENYERGLGYFELNNAAPPVIKDMAERLNAPYIRNEICLQDAKWNGEINEAASLLETIAESKGYAIGVLNPYPETVDFLKGWIAELKNKGFTLVPLSAIYTHKLSAADAPPANAQASQAQPAEIVTPILQMTPNQPAPKSTTEPAIPYDDHH